MRTIIPKLREKDVRAALAAFRKTKRAATTLRTPGGLEARKRTLQRAYSQSVVKTWLSKSGVSLAEFTKQRDQAQSAMSKLFELEKTSAIKASRSYSADKLNPDLLARLRRRVTPAAPRFPPQPPPGLFDFVVLDTPAFILPDDHLSVLPQLAPWHNAAKVTGAWESGASRGDEAVSFVFAWQNPSDKYAVINAATDISYNGLFSAYAGGWPPVYASIYGYTYLQVFQWWTQPPTWPLLAELTQGGSFDYYTTKATSSTTFLWDFPTFDVEYITDTKALGYLQMVLPPKGVVVFSVEFHVTWSKSGGTVDADFASGGFEIVCPALVLGVLT